MYIIISSIIIIISLICFKIYYNNKYKKEREKFLSEKAETYEEELTKRCKNIIEKTNNLQKTLDLVELELKQKQNFNNSLLTIREEELNRIYDEKKEKLDQKLKSYEELQIEKISNDIKEWSASAQSAAALNYQEKEESYTKLIQEIQTELQSYLEELNNYKEKRDAINKEIIRSRAVEEQQVFYQVQIDEDSKSDIEILKEIKSKLSKIELFNKFIYDNYISKPAKEMTKRVLEGRNPSGIYKITNINTKEIYIGKSVKISDRWINHIKSAYGLEGVADSQFQRALKKYGVENFTWEVIEEVEKEKLSEREKYYINFYGTKEYGYNMKEGG